MDFLEKNIEDIIWESDNIELSKRGLYLHGKMFRQLRIGNYGVADIVTIERVNKIDPNNSKFIKRGLSITIYELKKSTVGISAFLQSLKYAVGIKRYLEYRDFYLFDIRIVLIGKSIDTTGELKYIPDLICMPTDDDFGFTCCVNQIDFYSYNYKIDGIYFNVFIESHLINEEF
jgi:hypothetical protein